MSKQEGIEKLKTLPFEELIKYKNAALQTKRGISLLGISCFVFVFVFSSNMFVSIPLIITAAMLANTGVGVDAFLLEVKKNLLRFQSTDK